MFSRFQAQWRNIEKNKSFFTFDFGLILAAFQQNPKFTDFGIFFDISLLRFTLLSFVFVFVFNFVCVCVCACLLLSVFRVPWVFLHNSVECPVFLQALCFFSMLMLPFSWVLAFYSCRFRKRLPREQIEFHSCSTSPPRRKPG